jgi:hypothetical protein
VISQSGVSVEFEHASLQRDGKRAKWARPHPRNLSIYSDDDLVSTTILLPYYRQRARISRASRDFDAQSRAALSMRK